MNNRKVKTAVIAAGGYGTRFLPFTKHIPKEMLPIGGVPIIQRLVEECIHAGIEEIFIMTRPNSEIIHSHFTDNTAYMNYLVKSGKSNLLTHFINNGNLFQCVEVDISIPYGNLQGVLTIKDTLKQRNNFLLLWGDDLVLGKTSNIENLINKYEKSHADWVISIAEIDKNEMKHFGNVRLDDDKIIDVISKPKTPEECISNFAILGQMILNTEILALLDRDWGNQEPDITATILPEYIKTKNVIALPIHGQWITVGNPEQFLKANIAAYIHEGNNPDNIKDYINLLEENNYGNTI